MSEDSPKRSWWQRALRGLGFTLAGLVGLVVLALLFVLYTPWGTQLVAEKALAWYDDRIPGSVTVGALEGSLGWGLELHDVRLADAEGTTLVRVGRVELELSPLDAIDGDLELDLLRVVDAYVFVPLGDGFDDLSAPPSTTQPQQSGSGLPLRITGAVEVLGFTLEQATEGGDVETVVRDAALRGQVDLEDQTYAAQATAALDLPGLDLNIHGVRFAAAWREPEVRVAQLVASTSLGEVALADARFDVETQQGEGDLIVRGDREALRARFDLGPLELDAAPVVQARVRRGDTGVGAAVSAAIGRDEALRLELSGTLDPVDLRADLDLGFDPARLFGVAQGHLGGHAAVHLDGTEPEGLVTRARFQCVDCTVDPVGDVDAQVAVELVRGSGSAWVELNAAGVDAEIHGATVDLDTVDVAWDLRIAELSEVVGLAERMGTELPALAGEITSEGRCNGTIDSPRCAAEVRAPELKVDDIEVSGARVDLTALPFADPLAFAADVQADRLVAGGERFRAVRAHVEGTPEGLDVDARARRGNDRARVAAAVRFDDGVSVDLRTLDARVGGVNIDLVGDARLRVDDTVIAADGLRLRAGGASVRVDGRFDRAGPSDLSLRVDGLDLKLAEDLAGVPLKGRAHVKARVRGQPGAPRIDVDARINDLVWRDLEVGDVRLDLDQARGTLKADVQIDGGLADAARITARLPFTVDLAAGRFEPGRGSVDVGLQLAGLDLARLRPLLPDVEIEGTVTLLGSMRGSARRPEAKLAGAITGLKLRGHEVGDLGIAARYDDGRVTADASLEQGLADLVALQASAPVRVDLSRGRFDWRARGDHALALDVDGLKLKRLDRYLPELDASGVVDLDARLEGSAHAPTGQLSVLAGNLRYSRWDVGDLHLEATLGDALELMVDVQGVLAEVARIDAHLPVRIDPVGGRFAWDDAGEHRVSARIRDLALSGIDPTLPLDADLDVDLEARGRPGAPDLSLELTAERLVLARRRSGRATIALNYADDRLDVAARVEPHPNSSLALLGSVPLSVDLATPTFAWHGEETHRVHVVGTRIDERALRPVLAGPRGAEMSLDFTLKGEGNVNDYTVSLDGGGHLGHPRSGRTPVKLAAKLQPDVQDLGLRIGEANRLDVTVRFDADMRALHRGELKVADVPFEATLKAPELPIAPFGPLLPQSLWGPAGTLVADLQAKGTLLEPRLFGRLAIEDGDLTVVALNQRLKDIQLEMAFDGRRGELKKLRFDSGDGDGSAKGHVDLADGISGEVVANLDRFPVVRPGLPFGYVSTRVKAKLSRPDERVDVDVRVYDTEVRLVGQNAPAAKDIPSNENVVLAEKVKKRKESAQASGPTSPPTPMRVRIELEDPVIIGGSGARMRWGGAMAFTTGEETEVTGALRSQGGEVEFLGQQFDLTAGRVTLVTREGEVVPFLNVTATTQVDTYQVTATVRGTPDQPELILASSPSLPDYQVLTLLITGRADSADGESAGVQQQAASVLAAFSSGPLERELNDRLGIDRLGLSFGDEVDEPVLTVGKRLSRNVYVETIYHHNAEVDENETEARVELTLTPQWGIETSYGDAGVGGVELFWHTRFGGKNVDLDLQAPEKRPPDEIKEEKGEPEVVELPAASPRRRRDGPSR